MQLNQVEQGRNNSASFSLAEKLAYSALSRNASAQSEWDINTEINQLGGCNLQDKETDFLLDTPSPL